MTAHPSREPAARPEDLGQFFLERANAGDVEGLVALYEPDAVLAFPPGRIAAGHDEIREVYRNFLAGRPVLRSAGQRPPLRNGDLALTSTRLPGRRGDRGDSPPPAGRQLAVGSRPARTPAVTRNAGIGLAVRGCPIQSVGVEGPFDFRELWIRQPGRLLPGQASYEIFDTQRRLLAVAAEIEARPRLQALTGMIRDTRVLAVRRATGEPVLTLVKRDSEWLAELTDPAGAPIGRIRIGGSRRHYTLLDDQDQVVGEAVGDLAVKNFAVTGTGGARFAEVRKTWAGFRKELLTSSDHYAIKFTGPVSPRVRTLTVMMPIVLDLARYGPD